MEEKGNIHMFLKILENKFIPFVITEFGDLICVKNNDSNIELVLSEMIDFIKPSHYLEKGDNAEVIKDIIEILNNLKNDI